MISAGSSDMSAVSSARFQCVTRSWKNLAHSQDYTKEAREWFADLLWIAFPSETERELRFKAARALGCSPRQVANWLRCENDASLTIVAKVMLVSKAEVIFQKIEGNEK